MTKYTHTIEKHNLESPRRIVNHILPQINCQSVVDVGCGLGTFLRVFKEMGVNQILGIDGNWCKKDLLFENISKDEFLELDLEKNIQLNKTFDLAISLEVAEHLSSERAESFIKDLCSLSNTILFSAAVPFQGGDHHLNEKPLSYWIKEFNKNGYECHDTIRPIIWDDESIFWWYRQNTVLFKKAIESNNITNNVKLPIDIIHPELLKVISNPKDKNAIKRHLKILFRSITNT
ncbi:MAG: class I SAM-dependent methyltransferase [Ignavibacteriales bacterium]|nr:MAG: class I SAM-dependent methyltransferase [Ignavibacteriales bacterium]